MKHQLTGYVVVQIIMSCLLCPCHADAADIPKASADKDQDITRRAIKWVKNQQNPETALFRSYDMPGDLTAWTYDQAIAIIALTVTGDIENATRCANAMLNLRDRQHHAWPDGYNSQTKQVIVKPIAVGPNAWMGLALLRLYHSTDNVEYLSAVERVAEFMLELQVKSGPAAGSLPGGYDQSAKPFNWTSTEHNIDFIALMAGLCRVTGKAAYGQAAISAATWLDR